jgi:hypothetical protein
VQSERHAVVKPGGSKSRVRLGGSKIFVLDSQVFGEQVYGAGSVIHGHKPDWFVISLSYEQLHTRGAEMIQQCEFPMWVSALRRRTEVLGRAATSMDFCSWLGDLLRVPTSGLVKFRYRHRLAVLLLAVFLVNADASALTWSQPEQTKVPSITDTSVPYSFAFTNTATIPVSITSIKPSCSCTVAHLSKTTFQPGEKGSITVTFSVGSRTGDHTKTLVVNSTDPQSSQDVLILHVKIPAQASFSRRVLNWTIGSPAVAQSIVITIPKTLGMQVKSVSMTPGKGPSCAVALSTMVSGESYQVKITPSSTAVAGTTTFEVVTNIKTYHIYARITPPTVGFGHPLPSVPPAMVSEAPGTIPSGQGKAPGIGNAKPHVGVSGTSAAPIPPTGSATPATATQP